MVPLSIRRTWWYWRRRACESIGVSRYSRPGLDGLDRRLERWVDFDGGVFIEAGANDGFEQSNTYYLERFRGWSGVLVEPVPWLARKCRGARPRSTVVQAALVPFDYPEETIELDYSNLTSSVCGAFADEESRRQHHHRGLEGQPDVDSCRIRVPVRTLQSICEETGLTGRCDLLSLDVEGAEPMALGGIDFERVRPHWMLIEVRDEPAINRAVEAHYDAVAVLSATSHYKDVLYRRRI